jgi:hypothetical protein
MIFSLSTSKLESWFKVVKERYGTSVTAADVRMYTRPLLCTVHLSYRHSFLQLVLIPVLPLYCRSLSGSFSLDAFLSHFLFSCSRSAFTTLFLSSLPFYWFFLLLVLSCNEYFHAISLLIQLISTIHLFVFVAISE